MLMPIFLIDFPTQLKYFLLRNIPKLLRCIIIVANRSFITLLVLYFTDSDSFYDLFNTYCQVDQILTSSINYLVSTSISNALINYISKYLAIVMLLVSGHYLFYLNIFQANLLISACYREKNMLSFIYEPNR